MFFFYHNKTVAFKDLKMVKKYQLSAVLVPNSFIDFDLQEATSFLVSMLSLLL